MGIGAETEVSTLGQIVTFVEKMSEEEKEGLLRTLRLGEAMKLAKQHDERVRDTEPELTDEEIVAMVREVREELFKNGYQDNNRL
jgi:hypothetical protein